MNRHNWRPARVVAVEDAADEMVALVVKPDEWFPHRSGQHYEIRFPGEILSRKFSIASSPLGRDTLEFGISVLRSGMLTPRLAALAPGSALELRGPTGVAFGWAPEDDGPLVLIGGGAGVTPLVSIADHHRDSGVGTPLVFLVSARTPERLYRFDRYRDRVVTRFTAYEPRIDRVFLEHELSPVVNHPTTRIRVCGPPRFIGAIVQPLLELGFSPDRIRSEAFF